MNPKLELFEGRRHVKEFQIRLGSANEELVCTIEELWHCVHGIVNKCGDGGGEEEVTRRVGIEKVLHDKVTALLGASAVIKGIANIQASINSETGLQIKWDAAIETKRTIRFKPSPKCGIRESITYQKLREYELRYRDTRFFRTPFRDRTWVIRFTEWTELFYHQAYVVKNVPECGCDPTPDTGFNGYFQMFFPKGALETAYRRTKKGIAVRSMDMDLQFTEELFKKGSFDLAVCRKYVPEPLLFLMGDPSEEFQARVDLIADKDASTSVQHHDVVTGSAFIAEASAASEDVTESVEYEEPRAEEMEAGA